MSEQGGHALEVDADEGEGGLDVGPERGVSESPDNQRTNVGKGEMEKVTHKGKNFIDVVQICLEKGTPCVRVMVL